jgi:CheY-like chemotaxis protein
VPFDLRQCLEDALDLFSARAAQIPLELAYSLAPDVPGWVVSDVTRVRQILVNLIGNAVKFTAAGEVLVSVDVAARAPALSLHFAVRDTGIGIPADRIDRLFKSFSQVDSSTTRRFGGTGLGLAISHRLATLLGGRMWVESTAGAGSTFHFTIAATPHTQSVRINVGAQQPALEGLRILIVDDNETNRRILATQVRSWGMAPVEAGSAETARQLLAAGGVFDVALLDYQMPGMDGEALAAALRENPATARLPLLLLSSAGRRPAAGLFAASLAKPVKPSLLLAALGEIFHRPAPGQAPAVPAAPVATLAQRCPLKILVADDNPVNLKVAQMMLQRLGYRTDPAADGCDVLEAIARTTYDVILMDVEMPELDGLQTTQRIRGLFPAGDRPWIIALTANAMPEDREKALAAGMNDFLTKPFRAELLVGALEHAHRQLTRPAA